MRTGREGDAANTWAQVAQVATGSYVMSIHFAEMLAFYPFIWLRLTPLN